MTLELVVATSNPGKHEEIVQILAPFDVRLIGKEEAGGWPENIPEPGHTYLDNALIKAQAVYQATGRAALAEDSGIECDALDGAPGPRSARLAGPGASDADNNVRLISLLFGVPAERRTARYRCVAVAVFPDGTEVAAMGVCEGTIGIQAKGTEGFGYDPWFIPVGGSRSMAELDAPEKNAISHRGNALRALMEKLLALR